MSAPFFLSCTGPGCWRARRDGTAYPGLPAALAAVRAAWPDRPDLQALAWALLPRMPGLPLASDTVKERSTVSARTPMEDVVVSHGWLGLNTSEHANTLWLDIDAPDWRERLDRAVAAGLPAPAWISKSVRGAHLGWILRTPVGLTSTDLAADHRRARLLSVTLSYLRTALGADPCASHGGMTKNPFSSRWTTTVGPLDLVDLKDLLRPLEALAVAEGWEAPRWVRRSTYDPADSPRGTRLWDSLRFKAYATGEACEAVLREWADELAEALGSPAPEIQRAGMARRIAKFMATKWRYGRRTAPLSPAQLQARQAQAGRTVATARASSRNDALLAAITRLQARGGVPGQEAIAAEANVSLRTVKRAWPDLWDRIVNKVPYAPPTSGSSATTTPEQPVPPPAQPPAPPTDPVHAAIPNSAEPAFLRLTGWDSGIEPRFAPPRAKAAIAKWYRETWHRDAAKGGSRAYGQACAARWRGLHIERKDHLADLQTSVDRLTERANTEAWPNLVALAAAQERLRMSRLGWASRLAAEERAENRTRAAMSEKDNKPAPRFRTVMDGMDVLAMSVPISAAEAAQEAQITRVRESAQARKDAQAEASARHTQANHPRKLAPLSLMVLPDAAQVVWENSRKRTG